MRQATFTPGVAIEMQNPPVPPPPSYQAAISRGSQGSEEDGNKARQGTDQPDSDFHHVDGTDPPHHGQVLENYSDMGQDEYV